MAGVLEAEKQIPKTTDENFWSQGKKQLGPCWIYVSDYKDRSGTVLTGTLDATASATVTGTGTLFTTELAIDDVIEFTSLAGQTFRIKDITNDTSLELYATITVAADTATRISLIKLGCTDSTVITFGLAKTDLVCSQEGAVRGDRVVTGYQMQVSFGLADQDPIVFQKVTQGVINVYDQASTSPLSAVTAQAWGFPIGDLDSNNIQTMYLVRIVGLGVESDQESDVLTILRVAPMPEAEITRDAETQIFYRTLYEGYIDSGTTLNDVSLIWHTGVLP